MTTTPPVAPINAPELVRATPTASQDRAPGVVVLADPTQVRRPARAALRTAFAVGIALCSIAPYIYAGATLGEPEQATGIIGQVLGVAAAVTRVMALPSVEQFLRRFLPFLAAAPDGITAAAAAAVPAHAFVQGRALDNCAFAGCDLGESAHPPSA